MERKIWTKEETLNLIKLYKQKESLWNRSHPHFRSQELKSECLNDLAIQLSCSTNEVRRKLHNLRNQVSQELRKKELWLKRGPVESFKSKWFFFPYLEFLIPMLSKTYQTNNIHSLEINKNHEFMNSSIDEIELTSSSVDLDIREIFDGKTCKILDEFDKFGEYVASGLRSLHLECSKRKLKSEIRKSIIKIADEDDEAVFIKDSALTNPLLLVENAVY